MTTAYDTLYNLPEMALIAGSDKVLTFTAYAENGIDLLDISTATIQWFLCPYGQFNYPLITKDGIPIDANHFTVTLSNTETLAFSGKYIQQLLITDFSGNVFRPSQGTVIVTPAIGVTTGTSLPGETIPTNTLYAHSQLIWTIDSTNLTSGDVGIKPLKIRLPYVGVGGIVEEIFAQLGVAPASTNVQINLLKNGSTIFSAPSYIEIATSATYASKVTGFVNTSISKNDYFQIELVQGDETASDLVIHLRYKWLLTTS
jgi:hypothetical protein